MKAKQYDIAPLIEQARIYIRLETLAHHKLKFGQLTVQDRQELLSARAKLLFLANNAPKVVEVRQGGLFTI